MFWLPAGVLFGEIVEPLGGAVRLEEIYLRGNSPI